MLEKKKSIICLIALLVVLSLFSKANAAGWVDSGSVVSLETDSDAVAMGTSTPPAGIKVTVETNSTAGTLGKPLLLKHLYTSGYPDQGDGVVAVDVYLEDAESNVQDAAQMRVVWAGEPIETNLNANFDFYTIDSDVLNHVMTIAHDDQVIIGTTYSNAHALTVNSSETATSTPTVSIINAGAGDSTTKYTAGGQSFTMGIDNSTTYNDFVVSRGSELGTTDSLVLFAQTGNTAVQNLAIGNMTSSSPGDRLYIESSYGNVGITINNTGTDTDPTMKYQLSGTTTFSMGIDDSDSDKFKIGTSSIDTNTRMTIDSNGNIGFGTSTPGRILHAYSSSATSTPLFQMQQGSTGDAALQFTVPAKSVSMGIDNSDSDKMKITGSSTLDSSDLVNITTSSPIVMKVFGALQTDMFTSDPCETYPEGSLFYNDTSDYFCFCNGAGNDVQVQSPSTACF